MSTSIVLGLGGCLDSELSLDPHRLQAMVDRHDVSLTELRQPHQLTSERELLISVLAYLREGVGGERYVESIDALLGFESHFEHALTLGGTNVRAGRTLAQLGHPNLLHVPGRDAAFESLLVDGSTVPSETPAATYVPHLIVQYPAHLRIRLRDGELEAPHSNRLIYVNDPVSEITPLHEQLSEWIAEDGIVTLSGFNSIRDESILEDRLRTLEAILDDAPAGLRILYEDADYHVHAFRRRVWDVLAPRAAIVSMNEDELASFNGCPVDVADPVQIAEALSSVLEHSQPRNLVVHSKYWALATGPDASRLDIALESGVAAAGARYLEGDHAVAASLDTVRRHPPSRAGTALAEQLPVLMQEPTVVVPARQLDTEAPTTIGLGDTFLGGLIAGIVATGALLTPTHTVEIS